MDLTTSSLKERLRLTRYSRKECLAAMKGKGIPSALGDPVHRNCIIRGMRYHQGYGEELRGVLPAFTRALNARNIMSNTVPDTLNSPEEVPYCIWHPDVASEETYREVARLYPQMVYQVGRACGVAGYTQLYTELDILPDVHIAEEARECGNHAIYEAIVSQPVRYSIMNDYKRTIDTQNLKPANLNGDTCVRWMLDIKQKLGYADSEYFEEDGQLFPESLFHSYGFDDRLFNLTEDMHIDEYESDQAAQRFSIDRDEVRLLSEPLPVDLPTVQKDLLVVMAAYHGDVDRYVRLRRPEFLQGERDCCVRGIYHNTPFAVWWSKQPLKDRDPQIDAAINARFIMNNVLSGAPFDSPPFLIWYPTRAKPATYRHLAKVQPAMLPQIMHACIFAGYRSLFDELLPQLILDTGLWRAAELSTDGYYIDEFKKHVARTGVEPQETPVNEHFRNHISNPGQLDSSCDVVSKYLPSHGPSSEHGPYNGRGCDASLIDTTICLPEAWRLPEEDDRRECTLDYVEWPPKRSAA